MKRILYVMCEGIGNMVLSLPALEALHTAGYDISVVGKHPALDIVPDTYRAYTLDTLDAVKTPFDAVLLSAWSNPYIQKYGHTAPIGECPVYESDPINGETHEALIHFDLAACLDGVEMPERLSDIQLPTIPMDITDNETTNIILYLRRDIEEGKFYIVFANCAAPDWDKKRWHGYPELAHLLENDYHIAVIGSEHDKQFNSQDEYPKDTTFLYDLPLRRVAAILENAEWVVGNDCGLTHIASALDTKTIALFGATSREKNKPLGTYKGENTTRIMYPKMACSPCQFQQWESVCQVNECMSIITPKDVKDEITLVGNARGTCATYFTATQKKQTLAVVMRVKDAMDTIEECITAAARIADYFCIVDNGSTDGTFKWIREYSSYYPDKFPEGMWLTEGYDEIRDRRLMDEILKETDATWGMFLDADEIVSDQITRELVESWMQSSTCNAYRFRHVHFWNDTSHYRVDQRWKPRHNRIMWRITPESTITTDKHIHPEIVRNLKGRICDTDYVIKHYGHLDKEKNAKRAEFYQSIDNPSHPNWTGNTYKHMTDETELKLAEWDENTPIDERDFGNPSLMLVLMHGGGDMLMATPTIRALKTQNPDLEISVMGLGKTNERDFKTRQFFENNPYVHRYYDSSIDHHPVYWDAETFENRELPIIHQDLQEIQQLTRFDEIIITTLQSDYQKHKIDRFAKACGVALTDKRMEIFEKPTRNTEFHDSVFRHYKERLKQSKKEVPAHKFRYISIHRWCGNPNKSWDYQEYKTLIERLSAIEGVHLVLWDMGDPEEPVRGENIINMSDYDTNDFTLNDSYVVMANCNLHIGADSLPMHLASAVNTPTLAIFEKTLPSVAAPLNENAVIAASVQSLNSGDADFYSEHAHRTVVCGLDAVKADHLYPILHKMGFIENVDRIPKAKVQVNGYEISVPKVDAHFYENKVPNLSEKKVAKALSQYIVPNESVYMDVGANVGLHAFLIPDTYRQGIFIEPFPETYEMLSENLTQIPDANRIAINCAISDTEGKTKLHWSPRSLGGNRLVDLPDYLAIDVETQTIDSLGYTPDIIKIDVEGAELAVLKGASKTLKTVRAVVVELHDADNAGVFRELANHGLYCRYLSQNHVIATPSSEEMLPFPQNCLFDPAELLTVEKNQSVPFTRPADIYKALSEFDTDPTWWFEYMGIGNLDIGEDQKRIGVYEGGEYLIAPTLMRFSDLDVITILPETEDDSETEFAELKARYRDAIETLNEKQIVGYKLVNDILSADVVKRLDTLIATNLLGYHPYTELAEDYLFALVHRTVPKHIYINFLFSTDGSPTRYRGRSVKPYTHETLENLIDRFAKRGTLPVGDTDFENMRLQYEWEYPHAGQHVTRGRLLLEDTIPF